MPGKMNAGILVLLLFGVLAGRIVMAGPGVQDDWKNEFNEVCSYTHNADSMSSDELKSLIARCDALKPRIEKLGEPQRRITLKRLTMCRDLYAFVLDSRQSGSQ